MYKNHRKTYGFCTFYDSGEFWQHPVQNYYGSSFGGVRNPFLHPRDPPGTPRTPPGPSRDVPGTPPDLPWTPPGPPWDPPRTSQAPPLTYLKKNKDQKITFQFSLSLSLSLHKHGKKRSIAGTAQHSIPISIKESPLYKKFP